MNSEIIFPTKPLSNKFCVVFELWRQSTSCVSHSPISPAADRFEDMCFGTNFLHTSMNAYIYVLLLMHVSVYDYITKNGTNRQGLNFGGWREQVSRSLPKIVLIDWGFVKNEGVLGLCPSFRFSSFLSFVSPLSWLWIK